MSIASEIERLKNAKTSIASAIEEKGVAVPAETSIDEYGNYVSLIPSGDYATKEELEALSNTANADTRVEYVDNVLKTLGGTEIEIGAKVEFGSYVGTQASSQTVMSESTATTMFFDKKPKVVIIYRNSSNNGRRIDSNNMCFVGALTETYMGGMGFCTENASSTNSYAKYVDNTLYWYSDNYYVGSANSYNQAGITYEYMAIY